MSSRIKSKKGKAKKNSVPQTPVSTEDESRRDSRSDEDVSRRESTRAMSQQYSDDYDSTQSDQSYSSPERRPRSQSDSIDDNDSKSEHHSDSRNEGERRLKEKSQFKSHSSKTLKSKDKKTSQKPASVSSRPKLLPRRGVTQTSKSFLTTHLQAMIVNFESLQKQKVITLKNKIKELQDVAACLKDENKSLRQTQKQNDREMTEITAMVVYHEKNVKELKSKVRTSEVNVTTADSKTRKHNSVLVKLNDKLKEYQELVDNDNQIEEPEILEEKIETMEQSILKEDIKITELEKTLLSLKKKVKLETKKEQSRYQDVQKNINQKREENQSFKTLILEKSREIHRKNIYSRCTTKPSSFPAIGWYPGDDDEQPSDEKVHNWLKAINNTEYTHQEHS